MNKKQLKLLPFDWLLIGYSTLMISLIIVFARPFTEYVDDILFYASMILTVYVIVKFANEREIRWKYFIRLLYPVFLFTFLYNRTGEFMFLLFDHFLDAQLVAFEKSIFGFNPTLYIDANLLSVIPNEILSFCYFCYYFMIPVFFISLFLKKEYLITKQAMTAVCLTFFLSYLLFFLYPIQGPRYHYAGQYINNIEGPVFRQIVEYIIHNGAVRGGCMPSTHFAVALVINLFCFKHFKTFGWILLFINIGMAIGTFWGRFHYVYDVFIGGLIGLGATFLVWNQYNKWTSCEENLNE